MTKDLSLAERVAKERLAANSGLSLDLTRGIPHPELLQLTRLDAPLPTYQVDGFDVRNYGPIDGLPSMRAVGAEMLGAPVERVLAPGPSSLKLAYSVLLRGVLQGYSKEQPWRESKERPVIIVPTPAYDRHLTMARAMGFDLLPVPFVDDGPERDQVEEAFREYGTAIKAMITVPQHSNPSGHTYSPACVSELFALIAKYAAPDFVFLADRAYCLHTCTDREIEEVDWFEIAAEFGVEDALVMLASTSKLTHAGGGVAFVSASPARLAEVRQQLAHEFVSANLYTQAQHLQVLDGLGGIQNLALQHRHWLTNRLRTVEAELDDCRQRGLLTGKSPDGGYFLLLRLTRASSRKVVEVCTQHGLKLTNPDGMFPQGEDPRDECLRLAPTGVNEDELIQALQILTDVVTLNSI